nr:MAG TPA: hypothetical protein [Caudoviricetes sp.]
MEIHLTFKLKGSTTILKWSNENEKINYFSHRKINDIV